VVTTFMHLAAISLVMGLMSLFNIHLWLWLPAVCSMTITTHLFVMNAYFARVMKAILSKHMDQFNDPEEIGMMTNSPGIFIPQICLFTYFAKTDMGASLGWARLLSFAGVILGIVYKAYSLSIVGAVVFATYLFTHIGGMFYGYSQEANVFGRVRRYLSRIKKNVKSMTDEELQMYALKYLDICDKLNSIYGSKGPGAKVGPSVRAPKEESP
jgi:hypothetical protein